MTKLQTRSKMKPHEVYRKLTQLASIGLQAIEAMAEEGVATAHHMHVGAGGRMAMSHLRKFEERARQRHDAACDECGSAVYASRDDYTVRSEVWNTAHPEGFTGRLHLDCLEKRLGRRLRRDDFSLHYDFVNRHVLLLTPYEWEIESGRPLHPATLMREAYTGENATETDRQVVEVIRTYQGSQ